MSAATHPTDIIDTTTTKETPMPAYLLSVMHGDDLDLPDGVTMDDVFRDVDAFNTQIQQDGTWVFGAGLMPASSATVVRNVVPGAEPVITDGPYLETKEYMGGFWILKAADLDEALKLAGRASAACHGPIELRPMQDDTPTEV